jgi:hypothetical protein
MLHIVERHVARALTVIAVALALLPAVVPPAATAETYTFTDQATPETKAAVAAGRQPEKGYPAIYDVAWSTTTVRPNTALEAVVTTSTNIDFVGGKYRGWTLRFDQVGPGKFHVREVVPFLPPFLLGRWTIQIIARTSDGVEAHKLSTLTYGY